MSPSFNLTGAWSADDGGIYFIRQLPDGSVTWAGLHDAGFHRGMEFTNIFQGQIASDGQTLSGEWVDVPRGVTVNDGTLTLEILLSDVFGVILPTTLRRVAQTGGFGGETWTAGSSELQYQDIENLAGRVHRYDVPLGQNNPPCRDFSVMWGTIGTTKGPTWPPVPGNYCSFVSGDWDGDGDFTFDLQPAFSMLEPDFWTDGWIRRDFLGISLHTNEAILALWEQFHRFHCEVAMYARENDESDCDQSPRVLLPAWLESDGNSVLANGRPINGNINEGTDPPSSPLSFNVGPGGQEVVHLTPGGLVRVTGVVAVDAGHHDFWGNVEPGPPEIHPVYAFDVVQDWTTTRRRPLPTPVDGGVNLTGAWHSNDVGTYYMRQIGDTVWWLGMSRDQGRSFANVFRGTVGGGVIEGAWVDVPMGATGVLSQGSMTIHCGSVLATELIKISTDDDFGGPHVTIQLYDTATAVRPPVERSGSELACVCSAIVTVGRAVAGGRRSGLGPTTAGAAVRDAAGIAPARATWPMW